MDQPHGHNPDGAIRSSKGFQRTIVIQCITANFAQIMTWRFTGEDLAEECFPSGCCLQHYATQTQARCKSLVRKQKELNLEKKSPVERNIVRWNRRLDWIAWLLQTNLSSTVLNTKFENAHLFLSQYTGNLHTNNLWCQMILKGSRCIPAILLRVQRRV